MFYTIKDLTAGAVLYEGDNQEIALNIYNAMRNVHSIEWREFNGDGWDVYTHSYNYEEVKIACMLYDHLDDEEIAADFEDIFKVAHQIYIIYCNALNKKQIPESWMEIEGREEEGYIQAWFATRVTRFIDYYKYSF